MQAVLVMFRSDGDRRSFSITRDITVIGRREDCDLRLPLGDVSRKHCRLVRDGDSIRLEDLGSSNGTYHNGQRVQEAILSPGDSIQVGPLVFVLQIDGVPADEEMTPVQAQPAEQEQELEMEAPAPPRPAPKPPVPAGMEEEEALEELPATEEGHEGLEPVMPIEGGEHLTGDDLGFDVLSDDVAPTHDDAIQFDEHESQH